mmetsp:Transcript_17054/g.53518  ORF Transcript_17054/g.53518 Transcript_17054/m.53518 type:complete len:547 (-) Transcript_17054:50-1690(-)
MDGHDHGGDLLLPLAEFLDDGQERAEGLQRLVVLLLHGVHVDERPERHCLAGEVLHLAGLVLRLLRRGGCLLVVSVRKLCARELQQRRDLALEVLRVLEELARLRGERKRPSMLLLLEVDVRAELQGDGLLPHVVQVLEDREGLLCRLERLLVLLPALVHGAHGAEQPSLALLVPHSLERLGGPLREAHAAVDVPERDVGHHHDFLCGRHAPPVVGILEPLELRPGKLEGVPGFLVLDQGRRKRLHDARLRLRRMEVVAKDVQRLLGSLDRFLQGSVREGVGGNGVELERLLLAQLQFLVERLRLLRRPDCTLQGAARSTGAGRAVHGVRLALAQSEVPEDRQRLVAGLPGLIRLLLGLALLLQAQSGDEDLGGRGHLLVPLAAEDPEGLAGRLQGLLRSVGGGHLSLRLGQGEQHLRLSELVGTPVGLQGILRHLQGFRVLAPAAECVHVHPLRVGGTGLLAGLLEYGRRILGCLHGFRKVLRGHVPLRERDQSSRLLLLAAGALSHHTVLLRDAVHPSAKPAQAGHDIGGAELGCAHHAVRGPS